VSKLIPLWKAVLSSPSVKYKRAITECIVETAEGDARLSTVDGRIFETAEQTISAYRKAIAAGGDHITLPSKATKQNIIWGGVVDILSCRVRQFEERAGVHHHLHGNPVLKEKKEIIAKCVKMFSDNYDKKNAADNTDWHYDFYATTAKFAFFALNDLHTRTEARFYSDMLYEETEILKSVTDIQIKALGGEAAAYAPSVEILNDTYQKLAAFTQSIDELFKTAENNGKIQSADEFTEYVETKIKGYDDCGDALRSFKTEAAEQMRHKLEAAAQAQVKASAYAFKKSVFLTKATVNDICAEFGKLTSSKTAGDEREIAIISGITESIRIKLEAFDEQLKTFSEQTDILLNEFLSAADSGETGGVSLLFADEAANFLAEQGDGADLSALIKQLMIDFINDGPGGGHLAKTDRHCKHFAARLHKLVNNHKKDCLLYEVCTFEEILNYSVAILRGSKNIETLHFAHRADEIYKNINRVLTKFGIVPIKPETRDMFDGREHEVLTAETVEGFKKGEIIKVINSGYKQNGEVLLRANVIAAR
jgi:hypothetical protein